MTIIAGDMRLTNDFAKDVQLIAGHARGRVLTTKGLARIIQAISETVHQGGGKCVNI